MCLLLSHYVIQEVVNVQRHCNAKAAFVLILSVLCIFELSNKKPLVISSFSFRFFRRLVKKTCSSSTEPYLLCDQREPLFYKRGKSDFFCSKKFVMSLFRTIFAFGNGREVPNFVLVFPECLRSAFALPPLWLRFRRRRKTQGNAAAETRHKQEIISS